MIKLEEYEEEAEGKVFGGAGDEVSMIYVLSKYRLVSVLYFGYFSSFGNNYKPSNDSLHISILDHYKLKRISIKRGGWK